MAWVQSDQPDGVVVAHGGGVLGYSLYLKAGKPCPMAIIVGIDPATYIAARYTLADNVPELDWAVAQPHQPLHLQPHPGAQPPHDAVSPLREHQRQLHRRPALDEAMPYDANRSPLHYDRPR